MAEEIDLVATLTNIVKKNIRHKYYERTKELAKLYRQILTNHDADELMRKVVRREDDAAFDQRKNLTNHILMPLANSVLGPLKKVARSNDLHRELSYGKDSNGEQIKELSEILGQFNGKKSLDNYMRNRFLRLSDIDPNAWIVIEWPTVDRPSTERVKPYPFEVKSKEAIDYLIELNEVVYLCAKKCIKESENEAQELYKYTLYGRNQTVTLTQIEEESYPAGLPRDGSQHDIDGVIYLCINNVKFFILNIGIPHNLGYVPAIRCGYHTDQLTDDKTFVNTFHVSLPYFLDSVKAKSELNLAIALHAFPIRIQYDLPCPDCNGGKMPDGSTCGSCHGTGTLVTTSTQEIIRMPLPRNPGDMVPLNNMLSFVSTPTDIITLMMANIESIKSAVWDAVWNKDTITASEVQINVTATAYQISETAKYDNLFPCAEHLCEFWTFAANTIAKVVGLDTNLTAWMSVGKEFSIKSTAELTIEYNTQKTNGMAADIYNHTQTEIVRIMNSNDPQAVRRFEVRDRFKPFSDKTPDQINIILTDKTETTLQDRVLWKNYESIWDGMELVNEDIYTLNDKQIKIVLDKAVKALIVQINKEQSTTGTLDFTAPDGTGEEPAAIGNVEAEAKAKLKGTVGGITGLIDINRAIFDGVMSPDAAKVLIMEIYGLSEAVANALVQLPTKTETKEIAAVKTEINDPAKTDFNQ